MIVYVDVLVFLNLIVTYFLLLSTGLIVKLHPSRWRLLGGSSMGAISSLVIFLPSLGFVLELLLKLIICAVIVLTTFGFANYIRFLKLTSLFLAVTYLYAGGCLALYYTIKPQNMTVGNSVVYFNISPGLLIIFTGICYGLITLVLGFYRNSKNEQLVYDCNISINGISNGLRVLNDTGNSLKDPFFMRPVAIIDEKKVKIDENTKTYMIPLSGISGNTLAKCFTPDKFEIMQGSKRYINRNVSIALCSKTLAKEFDGLINPEIIDNLEEIL